ncbi:hypothetical protein SEA_TROGGLEHUMPER_16 [Rhodococcus phage Trogglehumper]|uniref:Uncharacterized protein n=1 Tax=Rhodococcus phage Trogglehumper TaxID=3038381 RepID=A0AAF0GIE0_9CAUD|nr:hypothetical protein SEA_TROGGLEHUMPER_16 [Rhodococcus phage Trogglehumper]
MDLEELKRLRSNHDDGLVVAVGALINSHIEANERLVGDIDTVNDAKRLSDEVVSLAYYLAKQLGEHVDDSGEETLTDTVQRLIQRQLSVIPRLPDVVYLAWPDPEKVTFERKSKPVENPALGVAVFVSELEALRFANESDTHYRVTCAPFGMTVNQARYDRNALLGPVEATEKKEPF